MSSPLTDKLLAWYAQAQRPLPWRANPTPYGVWVSEIMAQQTRIETVLPYFERWMQAFPSIAALAAAAQQDVLNLWEGLGYYSRARNLHAAAQKVVAEYGGQLPQDPATLRGLPGIGRYTAGAIASMAFGLDEPVVDGNVKRVLARVFDVDKPVDQSDGEQQIWLLAAEYLPPGRAGDYNQALMELGALVCQPRQPDCANCPLQAECLAYGRGTQAERPVKKPKAAVPHYLVTAAVIQRAGQWLIAQRPADGLLGGLWEFPGGKQEDGESLPDCLQREIKEELGVAVTVGDELGVYRHAYTHFKVTLHAFLCRLTNGAEPQPIEAQALRWVALDEMADYPMGKLDRQIADSLAAMDEGTR